MTALGVVEADPSRRVHENLDGKFEASSFDRNPQFGLDFQSLSFLSGLRTALDESVLSHYICEGRTAYRWLTRKERDAVPPASLIRLGMHEEVEVIPPPGEGRWLMMFDTVPFTSHAGFEEKSNFDEVLVLPLKKFLNQCPIITFRSSNIKIRVLVEPTLIYKFHDLARNRSGEGPSGESLRPVGHIRKGPGPSLLCLS
jgi:hypothetical protein